jgi:hypothetical protein
MVRFDPTIAKAKIDIAATYTNNFAEQALQALK